jgi:hypothetical protein
VGKLVICPSACASVTLNGSARHPGDMRCTSDGLGAVRGARSIATPRTAVRCVYSWVQTDFVSVYKSIAFWPSSRPHPDSLKPPKGSAASRTW